MIRDVADLLETVAASSLDVPALYATFLKALIAAKFDDTPLVPGSPRINGAIDGTTNRMPPQGYTGPVENLNDASKHSIFNPAAPMFNSVDFSTGEMGPVADVSTFPPRMAPPQTEVNPTQMLSMESILNSDFWDNVLVPGMSH